MVVNIFLFDDFEIMDAFGPAQIFGADQMNFMYVTCLCAAAWLLESRELKSGQSL